MPEHILQYKPKGSRHVGKPRKWWCDHSKSEQAWLFIPVIPEKFQSHARLIWIRYLYLTLFSDLWNWLRSNEQWNWIVLEKPTIAQPLNKFPAFYVTWRIITVFRRASPLAPIRSQMNASYTLRLSLYEPF
jgi:hypothetical protein